MDLRTQGFVVDFDSRGGKLKKQLERAAQVDAQHFVALGEREFETGTATFKKMGVAEDHPERNQTVELSALTQWLRSKST
jgi:histidyl-tRNA synthetase